MVWWDNERESYFKESNLWYYKQHMFELKGDTKDETVLLIDVGNGSIGAGLVVFSKHKIPKSIYNIRLPFSILEKIDAAQLESGMGLLLYEVLEKISKHTVSI